MNRAKLINQLEKQELDELIEFKELLENKGSKDSYKKMPDEDKGMYRSMIYVEALSHMIINYCILGGFETKELHKSEYHKAQIKEVLDDASNDEKERITAIYGEDDSFVWEEFLAEYDSNYNGLTMSQEEMDEMFGKGDNKAPFLKILDEVFDQAEKDGTLDELSKNYIENLYMNAADQTLEEDGITVEEFWGVKA